MPRADGVAEDDDESGDGRARTEAEHRAAAVTREAEPQRRQGQHRQRQRHRPLVELAREPRRSPVRAVEVAAHQRHVARRAHVPRDAGRRVAERLADDRARVGHGQRHRASLAAEQGAVRVEHARAEHAPERRLADDVGRDGLDQRPRRGQLARPREHELVGHLLRDERAHVVVLQRGGRPVRELVGVEQRVARVPRQKRGHEQEHRGDQTRGAGNPSHVHAGSTGSSTRSVVPTPGGLSTPMRPADRLDAVAQADEPGPAGRVGAADAVVADRQGQQAVAPSETSTRTDVACACLAAFASASQAT